MFIIQHVLSEIYRLTIKCIPNKFEGMNFSLYDLQTDKPTLIFVVFTATFY